MIQGYHYYPHSSIPQCLRHFVQGQGRAIEDASAIEIRECAEREAYFAKYLGSTLERTRRARVEFPDGYGYDVFLALLDEDNWCVRYIQVFLKVK